MASRPCATVQSGRARKNSVVMMPPARIRRIGQQVLQFAAAPRAEAAPAASRASSLSIVRKISARRSAAIPASKGTDFAGGMACDQLRPMFEAGLVENGDGRLGNPCWRARAPAFSGVISFSASTASAGCSAARSTASGVWTRVIRSPWAQAEREKSGKRSGGGWRAAISTKMRRAPRGMTGKARNFIGRLAGGAWSAKSRSPFSNL